MDAHEVRKVIDSHLSASPHAMAMPGAVSFCSVWPEAAPVLKLLVNFVPFIPTVGAPAAAALSALIHVGQQVYDSTCHPAP